MSTTNLLNNILIGTGHPDLINSIDFQGLMVRFFRLIVGYYQLLDF